jgi:hypothetical protein
MVEPAYRRANGFGKRDAEFFINFKCLSQELISLVGFSGIGGEVA